MHNPGADFAIRADRTSGLDSTHCVCGKTAHPSRRSAKRHLKTLKGTRLYGGEVYRCRQSAATVWHVGWSKRKRGLPILEAFRVALMELACKACKE